MAVSLLLDTGHGAAVVDGQLTEGRFLTGTAQLAGGGDDRAAHPSFTLDAWRADGARGIDAHITTAAEQR